MSKIPAHTTLRVARPSYDLGVAEGFWVEGVGLQVLWRAHPQAQGEHELLMLGSPNSHWHLELVEDPEILAGHPPSAEDLLILYVGMDVPREWLTRLEDHGGKRVPARNPYWDEWGVTILDPDGYRLVLSTRSWQ